MRDFYFMRYQLASCVVRAAVVVVTVNITIVPD